MAVLNSQLIKEIIELIAEISNSISPKCEIETHDKPWLVSLLKVLKLKNERIYFRYKRECSDSIITHFVREKGVISNRFHWNAGHIFHSEIMMSMQAMITSSFFS